MQALKKRFDYLFLSTRGLALVAIAVVALVTAIWGTLSGPMVEWGVRDITVNVLNMDLIQAEREGRIIMLYHTIAMTVIAIEVYFMTETVPMKRYERIMINATITVGYLTRAFPGGANAGIFLRYIAGCRAVALEKRIPPGSGFAVCPHQKRH